jgi:iron complex transport system substrate-binding protein
LIIATHLSSSHKKAQKAHKEENGLQQSFLLPYVLFVPFCGNLLCFMSLRILIIMWLLAVSFGCNSGAKPALDGPVTRVLTDDAGRSVSMPARVTRVISLAPNLTEIVFAVGGGDRLVGRTSYCDYPPEARTVAEIGDTLHPSLERIIALKPQVVLISTSSQLEVFTQQLQNQNIAVFVTDPHDLEGVFRSIQQVGEMLGQKEQSDLLVKKLRERTGAVEQAVKGKQPVRVFYQVSGEPLYTAGHDAFVTDLMRRARAISVTADVPGAWPKYSNESALAAKPDAIILPTGGSMGSANSNVTEALRQSPAVLQGRVYKINDDYLTRPGPRAIDGLEAMARALHPDAFK